MKKLKPGDILMVNVPSSISPYHLRFRVGMEMGLIFSYDIMDQSRVKILKTTEYSPITPLTGCGVRSLNQDLEYPGFEVEDQVWNRLLELRGSKIRKELELKKQQRTFAVMKRKLEALQADCDSVDSQVSRTFLIIFL